MTVTEILDCLHYLATGVVALNTTEQDITGFMDWSVTRSTWSIPRMKEVFSGKLDYYHPFKLTTLVEKDKWKENGYFHHDIAKHIFCNTVLPGLHDICTAA